jgi:hypothetical protein
MNEPVLFSAGTRLGGVHIEKAVEVVKFDLKL